MGSANSVKLLFVAGAVVAIAALGGVLYLANSGGASETSGRARFDREPAPVNDLGAHGAREQEAEIDEVRLSDEDAAPARTVQEEESSRPIAFDHPILLKNIEIRQRTMREFLPILLREQEGSMSCAAAARAASQLAVLTQLDAEGRSEVIAEGTEARLPAPSEDGYGMASGGAIYRFRRGEFPEYDLMQDLISRFPHGVPTEELPLDEIVARVRHALSYSIK